MIALLAFYIICYFYKSTKSKKKLLSKKRGRLVRSKDQSNNLYLSEQSLNKGHNVLDSKAISLISNEKDKCIEQEATFLNNSKLLQIKCNQKEDLIMLHLETYIQHLSTIELSQSISLERQKKAIALQFIFYLRSNIIEFLIQFILDQLKLLKYIKYQVKLGKLGLKYNCKQEIHKSEIINQLQKNKLDRYIEGSTISRLEQKRKIFIPTKLRNYQKENVKDIKLKIRVQINSVQIQHILIDNVLKKITEQISKGFVFLLRQQATMLSLRKLRMDQTNTNQILHKGQLTNKEAGSFCKQQNEQKTFRKEE